ncbi:MAG: hypothetical protein O2868_18695 [Proteobacteria bacterium]|nr:hypothetical protein [Pseudomonadota bacterium]
MKMILRKMFAWLLDPLESGDGEFVYKPSHRTILIVMSVLFAGLATLVALLMPAGEFDYALPVLLFGGVGLLGVLVGTLGNDRAVARIWGSGVRGQGRRK